MSTLPEKYNEVLDEAVQGLLSRAANSRGLSVAEVRPRVEKAVVKYLVKEGDEPDRISIRTFIDEIRADDLCLVMACEHGDEGAWEGLVADFDPVVRSAARKMTSNAEDAEDLAGSIWAELYGLRQDADGRKKSKLAYYSGRGSLAGWLRAVVSQLAIDEHRKQSRLVQIEEDREFENLAAEASAADNGLVSHSENPEDILSERETAADVASALRQAIDVLESEDKLILKLYYFDGLKLKDIASTFGYHEATASRRLARIQSEVRKSVEKGLKEGHGWTDGEVKRHLAETAERLGISLEKMFAILVIAALVQEMTVSGVL